MREIVWRLQAINIREVDQASFEAKIHGMELNIPAAAQKPRPVDPVQEQMIDAHLKRRQQEKIMEARGV
jgi:hypothetical protein